MTDRSSLLRGSPCTAVVLGAGLALGLLGGLCATPRVQSLLRDIVPGYGANPGSQPSGGAAAGNHVCFTAESPAARTGRRVFKTDGTAAGTVQVADLEVSYQKFTPRMDGSESFTITGIAGAIAPRQKAKVVVTRQHGPQTTFDAIVRIDAPAEVEYFRHGGILQMVLRQLLPA